MNNLATVSNSLHPELEELHELSFGWALACCEGRRDEAEDVLHQSYLKVLDGRAVFAGRSSFKTWFFGVVRLTARENQRRGFWQRFLAMDFRPDEPVSLGDPEQDLNHSQNADRLRRALQGLAARQREVLHLVFYQDMTIEEAAAVLGLTVGSARTHYQRGKARLRVQLEKEST